MRRRTRSTFLLLVLSESDAVPIAEYDIVEGEAAAFRRGHALRALYSSRHRIVGTRVTEFLDPGNDA